MILYTSAQLPFQVDAEDVYAVSRYPWSLDGVYVATKIGRGRTIRPVRLHVFLMGRAPAGREWDHRNRDKLDNRRANLRLTDRAGNSQNQGLRATNTSGFRGVHWDRRRGKWRAQIRNDGRGVYLGHFPSREGAWVARREAEKRLWTEPLVPPQQNLRPEGVRPSPSVSPGCHDARGEGLAPAGRRVR